jgi:uncharacterized protein YjiS (DUF1127 family)
MTMISTNCTTANATPVLNRVSLFVWLNNAHALWRQRQALKSLDAAALDDIGVTRAQADAEANRPVWDAPQGWRR